MAVGMELVKDSQADAFVTAGNYRRRMVTALFRLAAFAVWIALRWRPFSLLQLVNVLFSILALTPDCRLKTFFSLGSWEASMRKKCAASISEGRLDLERRRGRKRKRISQSGNAIIQKLKIELLW